MQSEQSPARLDIIVSVKVCPLLLRVFPQVRLSMTSVMNDPSCD